MSAPAIVPERWIEHLRAHLPVARAGADPEGVHQVRVACLRLRVFLWLWGRRVLDDDLRWLRDRCGSVRDLDVLLGAEPREAFARHLDDARELARAELLVALDGPRLEGLLAALPLLPPLPRPRAQRGVARLARRALRRAPSATGNGRHDADMHRLRRAVRRLRIACDWIDRPQQAVKELQSAFGRVNDLAVALVWLRRCPPSDALAAEAARLARLQEAAREEALFLWGERAALVEELA